MSIVLTSFKHLKLPISIKIPVPLLCLYLHDSYISKFFVNLLVAWLCKVIYDELVFSESSLSQIHFKWAIISKNGSSKFRGFTTWSKKSVHPMRFKLARTTLDNSFLTAWYSDGISDFFFKINWSL